MGIEPEFPDEYDVSFYTPLERLLCDFIVATKVKIINELTDEIYFVGLLSRYFNSDVRNEKLYVARAFIEEDLLIIEVR